MNSHELKQKSIDNFRIWKDAGKPRSGMVEIEIEICFIQRTKSLYKICRRIRFRTGVG